MGDVINISRAQFAIGDIVKHRLFDYRGVIFDVDPAFQLSEQWYEAVARSRPPKNKPWYHVMVHGALHTTYVAEQNLQHDSSAEPISHPMLEHYFSGIENGRYVGTGRHTN